MDCFHNRMNSSCHFSSLSPGGQLELSTTTVLNMFEPAVLFLTPVIPSLVHQRERLSALQ